MSNSKNNLDRVGYSESDGSSGETDSNMLSDDGMSSDCDKETQSDSDMLSDSDAVTNSTVESESGQLDSSDNSSNKSNSLGDNESDDDRLRIQDQEQTDSLKAASSSESLSQCSNSECNCCSDTDTDNTLDSITDDEDIDESSNSSCSNPHDDIDIMFKADADTLADIIFIVTFSVENNLSYKAMDKLVKRFVKPKLGKLSSIHMLRKWLCRSQVVPDLYLICSQEGCDMFWVSGGVPDNCSKCGEEISEKNLKKEGFFFLYSKVGVLLKKLLENPEVENHFRSYSQKIEERVSTTIDDITSAERYKEIKAHLHLSARAHPNQPPMYDFVSLVFSLDGVETSKSSVRSLEPLQIILAELSPYIRCKKILTPFLFIGDKNKGISFKEKYIKVFVDDLIQNFNFGFDWFSAHLGKCVNTKVVALAFCADTVGKHPILGIKSHNGYNSCPSCEIPGTSIKNCSVINYKPAQFDQSDKMIEFDLRDGTCLLNAEKGQIVDKPAIASIPLFQPFLCTGIDPMHGIDIGVFKKIFNNIFSTSKNAYSVGANGRRRASEVMLDNIKGADFMPRSPRSLSQFKHFKASEMHMLGFFFLVPIFVELTSTNVTLKRCFENYVDLIVGLSILYGDNISKEDILEAKKNLHKFYTDYTRIYGTDKCTTNIHLMVHVADTVQCLGPLWALSMYPFEAQNRKFVNSFQTNSKGILYQISERMQWNDCVEKLQQKVVDLGADYDRHCAKSWNLKSAGTTKVLGKGYTVDLSAEATKIPELWGEICSQPETAKTHQRAQVGRLLFSTRKYHEIKKTKEKNFYFRGKVNSQEVFGEILEILLVKGQVIFVYQRYQRLTICPVQLPENILRARHLAVVQKMNDHRKEYIIATAIEKQCIAMPIKKTNLLLFGFLNHNLEV